MEAIRWASSLDISNAFFETDCKGVVDRIGQVRHATTGLDAVILAIQQLLHANSHFSVTFVPRQANCVSHIFNQMSLT